MPRKKTTPDQAVTTTEQATEATPTAETQAVETKSAKAKPTKTKPTKGKPAKSKAAPAKPAKSRKSKATGEGQVKKLSALDAAAKVLEEATEPLNAQQMIAAMSDKGYWTSPGGKTPAATLYSALIREIKTKAADSRFKKTDRGLFTRAG